MLALGFGDKRKDLQDKIGDEHRKQSLRGCRVDERHVEDANEYAFCLHERTPFAEDVVVIPAEPVNACDDEQVAASQVPRQLSPVGPAKVLAAPVIDEYLAVVHARFAQGDELPVFVLLLGRDAGVAVRRADGRWCRIHCYHSFLEE